VEKRTHSGTIATVDTLRIGFITGEYPPMQGGVGAYTQELARALLDLGHRIHILTTGTRGVTAPLDEEGLAIHRAVPAWGFTCQGTVRRWLASVAPDVVSLQYEPAAFAMRGGANFIPRFFRGGPPIAVTFHDLLPPYLFPKAGPLRTWSVRQMARHADACVVTNLADEQSLCRDLGARGPDVQRIPIGSNIATGLPADYSRERTLARYDLSPHDEVVGFFGFLNRSKGIETLLRALQALRATGRSTHLLLIGGRTGSSDAANVRYAGEVDRLIDDLGLAARVHRTGFIDGADVSAALTAVDVCALPYRDGVNLRRGTLHAALAHGCAIVTTQADGPADDLEGAVLLVRPEDPAALAKAIATLVDDDDLRGRCAEAAEALAGRFSWPRIACEFADVLWTIVGRHRPPEGAGHARETPA